MSGKAAFAQMHAAHSPVATAGGLAHARRPPAGRAPTRERRAGLGPNARAAGASGRLGGLLVTCDQVVVCGGRVLEKPASPAQARSVGLG